MKLLRLIDEHELGIASVLLASCLLLGMCIGFDLKLRSVFPPREYVVATDHSPPFQIVHPDGSVSGVMVEALSRAAERLRVKLRWKAVKGGPDNHLGVDSTVDLWPLVMHLPERKDRFYIAQTFANASYLLISSHRLSAVSADSIAGKRIAIRNVPHFRSLFAQLYPKSIAVPISEVDDILLAACRGEVFGSITEPSQLQDFLLRRRDECTAGPLSISGLPEWRIPLSIASTFANAPLADALRVELGILARKHELDDLFARYQPLSILRDADTFGQTERERASLSSLFALLILAALSAFLGARVIRLRRKAARAIRLVDDRYRYLADMSHELRTPLNGILGMANLLQEANLSTTHRDYLKVIEHSGNELLAMINNILDLAKLESQGCSTDLEWISPPELSEALYRTFVPTLRARGIESVLEIDPSVPVRARIDAAKFRQIFVNLAGNAVKFTEKGFVHVRVCCMVYPTSDRNLRVEIIDSGPGISPGDQAKLFHAFEQAGAGRDSSVKGTGLGLEISKRLAFFAGGCMGVTSTLNKGSAFWFELPFEADTEASMPPALGEEESKALLALHGKRVAVVGGHPRLHTALRNDLVRYNAELRSYSDLSALPSREAPSFDMILLDYESLPAHGSALLEDLQALREASSAELFILCNGTQTAAAVESWGAPWLRILLKPVRGIDLARMPDGTWNDGAGLKSLARAVSDRAGQHAAISHSKPAAASERLRILVGEDNPINRMVIKAIIERLGHEGTVAPDGQRLVEELDRDAGYSLILMDCNMPGLDGFEATRKIRQRFPDRDQLPIVAVTANCAEDVYEQCIASGMNSVVTKPVTAELLRGVVERYATARQSC